MDDSPGTDVGPPSLSRLAPSGSTFGLDCSMAPSPPPLVWGGVDGLRVGVDVGADLGWNSANTLSCRTISVEFVS